jgi:cytoskeletal protein CcmA (bactofilin family)
MKKLFALFTLIALSVVSTESIAAHTPDVIAIDCIADALPGGAYLTIAGKFGGEITIAELAEDISLDVQGCVAGAKIFQFVLVINKGGKSQSIEGDSSHLTKEMHKKLKELSKGDEFTFKDVKAHLNSTDDVDVWAKKFVVT